MGTIYSGDGRTLETSQYAWHLAFPSMVTSTAALSEPAPVSLQEGVSVAGGEVDVLPQSTSSAAYVDFPPKSILLVAPFGGGAATQTFDLWITGWRAFRGAFGGHGGYWVPVILAKLTCALGSGTGPQTWMSGVSNGLACDNLTLVESRVIDPPGVQILEGASADGTQAVAALDTMGYSVIGFHIRRTTADGNLLWSAL